MICINWLPDAETGRRDPAGLETDESVAPFAPRAGGRRANQNLNIAGYAQNGRAGLSSRAAGRGGPRQVHRDFPGPLSPGDGLVVPTTRSGEIVELWEKYFYFVKKIRDRLAVQIVH
jgi:hypothetical protein